MKFKQPYSSSSSIAEHTPMEEIIFDPLYSQPSTLKGLNEILIHLRNTCSHLWIRKRPQKLNKNKLDQIFIRNFAAKYRCGNALENSQ